MSKNSDTAARRILKVLDDQVLELTPEEYAEVLAAVDGDIVSRVACLRDEHDDDWQEVHLGTL